MLLRGAILLTFLAICPSVFCSDIGSSNNEESLQGNDSQLAKSSNSTKRQMKKTHLYLHNMPPKALNASEGDSMYLECMAGGTPTPIIHWLKDGTLIPQVETSDEYHQNLSSTNDIVNTKTRIYLSFTMSRLYLDCLSVEAEGEYTCVAENPYHRLNASTQLAVLSSDEIECENKSQGQAPRINLWTKTTMRTIGYEAKFICRANGDPTPNVRWLHWENEVLTNADSDKYEILPNGDLIVRNLSWSDRGTYSCIAKNVHGESKVEVFLYPAGTSESLKVNGSQSANSSRRTERQVSESSLHFHTIPPKALNASEGDSMYLECLAGGRTAPIINWLKDWIPKTQLETSDEYHQNLSSTNDAISTEMRIDVSFTTSRLYLDCLSVEDQGEYTCVAESPYQLLNASTNLTVLSSDEEIECKNQSHDHAPRINLWTKTMIGTLGHEAKFFCRANGDPTPKVRWLRGENEQLTNTEFEKYKVLPNGDLIVRNLNWSDMGTYSCIAENVHGESKVEVFLYPTESSQASDSESESSSSSAERQPRETQLRIHTESPKALYTSEGDSYLECQAGGTTVPTTTG